MARGTSADYYHPIQQADYASTYLNFQNRYKQRRTFIVDSAALFSAQHFHDSVHVEYHNIHLKNVNLNFSVD